MNQVQWLRKKPRTEYGAEKPRMMQLRVEKPQVR